MLAQQKRVTTKPVRVMQLNTNRSTTVMHTVHANHIKSTDLILYQEPGFAPYPAPPFLPPNVHGFTPILPIPIETLRTQERSPRVMAYFKPRPDFTVTPRYDLCEDLDMMIMEVRQPSKNPLFIVNLYNPPRGVTGAHGTGERLTRIPFPADSAIIIAGDFNLHHPDWEEMDDEPIPAARTMADWFQEHQYDIHNAHNVPTYLSNSGRFQSVLDLTLSNSQASRQNLTQDWRIDPNMREISDHVAIRFDLGHGHILTDTLIRAKWNWKKANQKDFTEAFQNALLKRLEPINSLKTILSPTTEQLEAAVEALHDALEEAANKTVPEARQCNKSVPWWDGNLTDLSKARENAKRALTASKQLFGYPLHALSQVYKRRNNLFRYAVKRAKKHYFRKLLEEASGKDIYQFRNWSKATRNYVSSPLETPEGTLAVTPEEKGEVLLRTHFPPPADLPDELPDLQNVAPDDIAWTNISRAECLRALFATSPDKAAGEDGIPTRALQWTWDAGSDAYHTVISKCIQAGHHPQRHHQSIAAALRKPGKDNYAKPRAWRLIHLLNTLGKWIEKVVANRLLYYGIKHDLIPRTQFGAMPGRSTVDAALCLTHDIKAADNHGLFTSVLTFDITGYFDNVNHAKLLKILRRKGVPLSLCKWVKSFVSDRWVQIRVDGTQNKPREARTGCPQGSPVSGVLANYYSAPLLEIFQSAANEFTQNHHDEFGEFPELPTTDRQSMMSVDLFVDDGKLHTSSTSLTENATRLQNAFKKVLEWAAESGVSIDYEKIDYINFARKGKRFGVQPDLELPLGLNIEATRLYQPKESIRWLGIILDPRLTFNEHVKHLSKRGAAASNCLGMLANTISGLSQAHVKTLYTACVLPTITYAAPVWWTGKKTHLNTITKIQNKCLRKVLPVFSTTPIAAMETESGIPPLNLRLDHICARASARLAAKIDNSNPTYYRLPQQRQNQNHNANLPEIIIPLPITPITHHPNHPTNPSTSPIHNLLMQIPLDLETNYPDHMLDPWRTETDDYQHDNRLDIIPAQQGTTKDEAARIHREDLQILQTDPTAIIVYTDGSLRREGGENRAGAGWVVYHLGVERNAGREGLGTTAEVYDAEMLALPRGFQSAVNYIRTLSIVEYPQTHITLFSDNTSAVQSIANTSPHSSQTESREFIGLVQRYLDGNRRTKVKVAWVPGHKGIEGNERADTEAKDACQDEPTTQRTTISHHYRSLRETLESDWRTAWASHRPINPYATADRIPPSLKGSYAFRNLPRTMLGLVTQIRTGHGYFGDYYARFNIPEPHECPCGIENQSRWHILMECPMHDRSRHAIYEAAPDGLLTTLLGTRRGIDGLASFLRTSDAFRKRPPRLPPPQDDEEIPNQPNF